MTPHETAVLLLLLLLLACGGEHVPHLVVCRGSMAYWGSQHTQSQQNLPCDLVCHTPEQRQQQ
jgi:hypothetical protein